MTILATLPNIFKQVLLSHSFFHQNAPTLTPMFNITKDQAKAIITICPNCQKYSLPSVRAGVNPQELHSLQI